MSEKKVNNILSLDNIIALVASSISIVYGVTSLVSKKSINKTNEPISLTEGKLSDAIFVKKRGDKYNITVYVAISKDVRKNEVEVQISTQIAYDLAKALGISQKNINVTTVAVVL